MHELWELFCLIHYTIESVFWVSAADKASILYNEKRRKGGFYDRADYQKRT